MALNENTELVSSSKYDIYSKLIFIASKYFDVQNEDFLKTGLFGYITESMAMVTRDSSFHKTMLYNESFLNTAVMPKSVYNWAKMFGVSVPAATPAYADLQMTIPVESLSFVQMTSTELSLAKYSKYGSDLRTLINKEVMIVDRSNTFLAGQFNFTMERSVFLYRDNGSVTPINVKYCQTEDPTTLLYDLSNFSIKSVIQDNYISFVVRAFQYDIIETEKTIASSSFLDTKSHRFFFTDQFVGANLEYRKSNRIIPIELRFSNISTIESTNPNFGVYSLVDDGTIQITFSSNPGDFMPSSNSSLLLKLFTTKGAAGNIAYTGDVIFRFREESLKNIPVLCNFFDGASLGGIDTPDISRLKSTIINEISTRDVIVTEADLNNYFLILTSLLETVNDGKITFIKKRDDILRRIFSAYILMRDGLDLDGNVGESGYASKVIPTNTISSDFAISSNMSKPFGTIIKRKAGTLNEYEYVPSNALDGDEDYYVIPFYLRVNLDPFRKVKYIYNLTDDSTSLSYDIVPEAELASNSTDITILPSSISIKRGLEGSNASNFYLVTASFVSNQDFSGLTENDGEFRMSFIPRNSTSPREGKSLVFTRSTTGGMDVTSIPDENGSGRYNVNLRFTINVNTDISEFNFSSEESTNNYGTFLNISHDGVSITLPEEVKISIEFTNVLGINKLRFISDRTLLFFRNLDELMFSDIAVNTIDPRWNELPRFFVNSTEPTSPLVGDYWLDTAESANDLYLCTTAGDFPVEPIVEGMTINTIIPTAVAAAGSYYVFNNGGTFSLYQYDANKYVSSVTIKDIPVVHQSFFSNEANQTKFIKQLFIYIDTLKENLGKLETNTFFDLKFYNTYGPSQYYNSLRTDMDLELDVYVYEYSDTLALAIKDFVRLVVDASNNRSALRVSSLIKDLTSNFDRYIDHIDFKGLNGTFTQYISEDQSIAKNLYAPEYFNIPLENIPSINVKEIPQEE
jgi:hypothetical protein